jgi:hypothetical protein
MLANLRSNSETMETLGDPMAIDLKLIEMTAGQRSCRMNTSSLLPSLKRLLRRLQSSGAIDAR